MIGDHWEKLVRGIVEDIERQISGRVTTMLERFSRQTVKVVFDEAEAAKFLCCSKADLAEWRRKGIIDHACYPQGRGGGEGFGRNFTYDMASLLTFRERYIIRTPGASVYQIRKDISGFGAEIEKKSVARAA